MTLLNDLEKIRAIEKNIADTWISTLPVEQLNFHDSFFEMGGNYLLAEKVVAKLKNEFKYDISIANLSQFPTVSGMAKFILDQNNQQQKFHLKTTNPIISDVAVIGMAGRFPGADTIEELWEILKNGKETIRFFTTSELDASISSELKSDPDYIRAKGIINNADKFDASFFDMNPNLAALMDPQQRVFLEIVWELLEKTGHLAHKNKGSISVYAGTGNNSYYTNNVLSHPQLIEQVGALQVSTLNEKDYIATRTAYQLNLKGPAVSVHSSCSTSLLAIAQAVECIRKGQSDVAIAGGACITSPLHSGHLYQEGSMLSSNGHCCSFDADASGTVFSDGAGVVLLKGMEAAIRDGDTIYALIKGVGINNNGGGIGSFIAPSSFGQAGAIRMALEDAGIEPGTISYVEAHGTATPVGDPVEVEGLKMAFGNQAKHQYCGIGSIKSNIGHLTAAAGVAGLIKTVLALHYRQIPASLGYVKPNPNIDFENSPFYINTKLTEWKSESVRRAGVSSYGIGGTNVHLVLEEFVNEAPISSAGRPLQLITWSAKSNLSLDTYAVKLADYIDKNNSVSLGDTAFTLQTTRAEFDFRRFELADNTSDLTNALLKNESSVQTNTLKEAPGKIFFMFPGQGSQYYGMGTELYENELIYREAIDECAAILLPYLVLDIRQIIFPGRLQDGEDLLNNTRYTQPAIFVTEYALSKLWISWGIEPTIFCGHSIGEFVAAYFAGIFTLPDALKLIAARGLLVSELPPGNMLSVRMPAKEVIEIMPEGVSVAAINSNKLCVVAGEQEKITAFAAFLTDKGYPNKTLLTSHAFHSEMMDPVMNEFEKIVSQVELKSPVNAIISTVSGTWLTDVQATDPHYWATHLRSTVLFADAIETILIQEDAVLIEVGPGSALSVLVKQQAGLRNANLVTSLDKNNPQKSEYGSMLRALGQLWLMGVKPDWELFYSAQKRIRINLPAYSFDRKYCWLNPVNSQPLTPILQNQKSAPPNILQAHVVKDEENLINKIKIILEKASGIDATGISPDITFLEMGLDSLLMTQVALTLKKKFGLPLTFRQLNEEFATPRLLARYLRDKLPPDLFTTSNIPVVENLEEKTIIPAGSAVTLNELNDKINVITRELQLLTRQFSLMQEGKEVIQNEAEDGLPPFNPPPVAGAKLGRDKEGNPGWYVSDKNKPGKFLRVEIND